MDPAPARYAIRINGHLGATVLSAFPALAPQHHGADTVLTGLLDRSALYGVLAEIEGGPAVSPTATSDRFTTLPDEHTLAATVVALEEHGFSVEVVDDLDAARQAVLARIPHGSSVMTNTSVTLAETGIADAINDGGGPYDSARNKMVALDFATQAAGDEGDRRPARLRPGQRARGHPRRHAGHRLGLGQPARLLRLGRGQRHLRGRRAEARAHPGGGARADLPAQPGARGRPRAVAAYGQHSQVGKILEIHQELPGRIHIVLIRQQVGF